MAFWYLEHMLYLLVVDLAKRAKDILLFFIFRIIRLLGKKLNLLEDFVVSKIEFDEVYWAFTHNGSDGVIVVIFFLAFLFLKFEFSRD